MLHQSSAEALAVADYLAAANRPSRPARRTVRFAGLLAGLSAQQAGDILLGLRSSRQEIQKVVALVGRWHIDGEVIGRALLQPERPSDAAVRRWVASIGRLQLGSFMRLAAAIWSARRDGGQIAPACGAVHALYRRMHRSAFRDAIDLGSLAVDGDDLRRIGIPTGPPLGMILQKLLDAVLDDPARNATDWLLQEARRLYDPRLQEHGKG
jgi:hypothetical protein